MENRQWFKRILSFATVVLTISIIGLMYWLWDRNGIDNVRFSKDGYFYSETLRLKLSSKLGAEIYYTLDGSVPDDSDMRYTKPILLEAGEEETVYPVSAVAYFEDGTKSDIVVHNYVVGQSVANRYDTCVVFLTTEPDNFYDDEIGIYVEGNHMNYTLSGRESERPVHVEIANLGDEVIDINAGVRISGNACRSNWQKSLKLYARTAYDVENRFRGLLFEDVTDSLGQVATEYQRLLLRNSGNDFCTAFIRDTLIHKLAKESGYPGTKSAVPCCAYINGEYLGFYWLQEVYDEVYFENHYREYEGEFQILKGSEFPDSEMNLENDEAVLNAYTEMYGYALRDLTVDENFEKLEELVDVEDYLQYYAIQQYIGAGDWQTNNFIAYRYLSGETEKGVSEEPFDGKWRFLLHDLDVSFGLYGKEEKEIELSRYAEAENTLFGRLMQRSDCREYFMNYTLYLMNTGFSVESLNRTLDELLLIRNNELGHFRELLSVQGYVDSIRDYGTYRNGWVKYEYGKYFHYGEPFDMTVTTPENTELYINGMKNVNTFQGVFLDGLEVTIDALTEPGYEIDYWIVNGEKVYSEEVVIQQSDIKDGNVQIELAVRECNQELPLLISEFSSKGDEDYIVLYNPNNSPASTAGYSLADTKENRDAQLLNKAEIAPHSSITVRCNNAKVADGKDLLVDFALKTGETICLRRDGNIIEEVLIPDIKDGYYLVKNLCTGEFFAKSK